MAFETVFEGEVPVDRPLEFHIRTRVQHLRLGPTLEDIENRGDTLRIRTDKPLRSGRRSISDRVVLIGVLCTDCGTLFMVEQGEHAACPTCEANRPQIQHPSFQGSPMGQFQDAMQDIERDMDRVFGDRDKAKDEKGPSFDEQFDRQWAKLSELRNIPDEVKEVIRKNTLKVSAAVTEQIVLEASAEEYKQIEEHRITEMIIKQIAEQLQLKMQKRRTDRETRYETQYVMLLPRQIMDIVVKSFWSGFDYHKNQEE